MTIEELREKRRILETDIEELLRNFYKDTSISVEGIKIDNQIFTTEVRLGPRYVANVRILLESI